LRNILSVLLPGLLIFSFIFIDITAFPESKNILIGIYLFFPTIYIFQGIISANSKKVLFIGLIVSSVAAILPTEIWYNMSSLLIPITIYILLALLSYYITNKIKAK
jgi:hypothetical protein